MSKESAQKESAEQHTFLAFAKDAGDLETLKTFAVAHGWTEAEVHQGDIQTATEFLKDHRSPSLLLVELPSAAEAPALLDALANVCAPDTKVITIGAINEYSFYCWLMDIGIFSYLLKPLTRTMLEGAYQKATEPVGGQVKEEKKLGKVVAVIGTRGGVGATTISINLAGIFAEELSSPVALIDVDPHVGSVALSLDLEPSRGLREAMEKPDRIDSLFIERVMLKPHKNLSVLSAEEALHDHLMPHELAAEALLTELKSKFRVVVLDIPRRLNAHTVDFLKRADHIVLVSELTLLSLRDALRLGDLFRDALKHKPPIIVANRIGMAPKMETQVSDFEKGVGAKVTCKVPYVPEVFMQISGDIPAVKLKSHAAMKELYTLAEHLVPEIKPNKPEPEKKSFNLLKRK